jgi:UDP-2-acetamido-2,6-beta-L-arabino-hexul-4-ose reductase
MSTVLVTGSDGFIGRNLIAHLGNRANVNVIRYDIGNSKEDLWKGLNEVDFIFHLAGVNRPKDISEFEIGNKELTEEIVEYLCKKGKTTPLLISSSIQAALANPYGKSKLGAEKAVFTYERQTGARIFVFRIPNIFGKWCRPNYNSVVATWCHNTTHSLPIKIDNPNTELTLAYVDDVINAFLSAFDGLIYPDKDDFCKVPIIYKRTLGNISESLSSFSDSRVSLVIPAFTDDFERKLYATWLSYLPEDKFEYTLEMKRDDRGWLSEFIKSKAFGQVFISKTKPGITRGNHWHHTKVEKFLVVLGRGLIRFRKIDSSEVLDYHVSGEDLRVVDIPVGYTHSITNIGDGDLITLFWADEIFNPDASDTYFLEV